MLPRCGKVIVGRRRDTPYCCNAHKEADRRRKIAENQITTQRDRLRAVAAAQPTVAPQATPGPGELLAAAIDGDERALLAAMRLRLARLLDDGVAPNTVVGLMRYMHELDKEIRQLDETKRPAVAYERGGGGRWDPSVV